MYDVPKRSVLRLLLPMISAGLLPLFAIAAYGQNAFPTPAISGRSLPSDREWAFTLHEAEQLLETERSLDAIEVLQSLWDLSSDTFLPTGESLRERLHLVFQNMSPENFEAYNRRYDSEASRLFEQAIRDDAHAKLEEVIRRFYFTRHGLLASHAMAIALVDRGDLIGGARYLELAAEHPSARNPSTLLSLAAQCWHAVGETERAAEIIEQLNVAVPQAAWSEGTIWTPHPEASEWMAFRQSPLTHSSNSAPVSPLGELAWESTTIEFDVLVGFPGRDEEVQQLLAGFVRRMASNDERQMLPVLQPVAVGDVVILNSYCNTWAIEAATGELRWSTSIEDVSFGMLFLGKEFEEQAQAYQPLAEYYFGQRAWRDLTKGMLSTDGTRVFAISNGGMVAGNPSQVGVVVNNSNSLLPCDFNVLLAFAADEGELLWQAGGNRGVNPQTYASEDELVEAGKLTGLYFLGSPLPADGRLYCLAEDRGEVGLYVLDAASGAPLWSLPLAQPYNGVSYDYDRRWAGLTPVLAGQLLVCPTGDGTLIGIDVISRSIQWVVEYQAPQTVAAIDPLLARRMAVQGASSVSLDRLLSHDRWLDSVPLVDGRRVLYTPFDAKELYCFDLVDGTISWVRPRGQSWFLGGVFDNNVLVVGQDGVHAVDISTGDDAWEAPVVLPPPAGRGVQSGRLYHLPLSTREIVTVDIPSGRVLARSPLPDNIAAGNLLALKDRLVMITPEVIVGFSSLSEMESEIERQLAADPQAIAALRMRGELRLHQDQAELGMADLQIPVDQGDQQARNLLAHLIAEGIRSDFEAYRERASEVSKLITDPVQLREFTKTYVAALESHGEFSAAFEQLLRLVGEQPLDREELLSDGRRVRSDRWLTAWLARVHGQAMDLQQEELNSRLVELIATCESPRMLRDLSLILPSSDFDRRIIEQMSEFDPQEDPLLRERVLLDAIRNGEESSDQSLVTSASIQLLELYRQTQNADGVTWMVETLTALAESGDQPDSSAAEALARLRSDPDGAALIQNNDWPEGRLTIDEGSGTGSTNVLVPLPILGSTAGPLDGWTFLLEPNLRNVYAKDARGALRWSVPSSLVGGNASQAARYVEVHGSHVLCVFGDRLLLIDAFAQPEGRVIGSEQLILDSQGANGRATVNRSSTAFRFRGPQAIDPFNQFVGNVGPMTAQTLCFQLGPDLIGLDPDTGRRVWQQGELPPGCEFIGDDEYLLAKPPHADEFLLFSMSDGRALGTRPLPENFDDIHAEPETLVDWGRCWLTASEVEEGELRLAMYDFVEQRDRWAITLPADSLWSTVDGTDIATLTPEGTLTIHDDNTGEVVHAIQLEHGRDWMQFSLRRHSEGWILLGNRRLSSEGESSRRPTRVYPPGHFGSEVNGEVILIDRPFRQVLWTTDMPLQVLPNWQPTQWPILAFGCRRSGPRLQGDNFGVSDYYAIQVLDARTGERLYEDEIASPQIQPVWDAPDEHRLELRFGTKLIEVSPQTTEPTAEGDAANESAPPAPPQSGEPTDDASSIEDEAPSR